MPIPNIYEIACNLLQSLHSIVIDKTITNRHSSRLNDFVSDLWHSSHNVPTYNICTKISWKYSFIRELCPKLQICFTSNLYFEKIIWQKACHSIWSQTTLWQIWSYDIKEAILATISIIFAICSLCANWFVNASYDPHIFHLFALDFANHLGD